MTTKRYLGQLKYIDKRIKNKIDEIDKWNDAAIGLGSPTMDKNKVQTSRKLDKQQTAIAHLLDAENELEQALMGLASLKKTIIEQIDSMEDEYYFPLHAIYVLNYNSDELATAEDCTRRTADKRIKEAETKFEEKFGELYLRQ